MHRLILLLALSIGCVKAPVLADPSEVAAYRSQIGRVRDAIAQTREAIVRAQQAPYLPELYLRLAELTAEEARFHYLVAAERHEERGEALHLPHVRMLKEEAIGSYRTLATRFPDHELAPQALFHAAHEHRELGQFVRMEALLSELISSYPDSPYRHEAHLVLGNHAFDAGSLDEAARHFRALADEAPARLSALGHHRLGWVAYNHGDCEAALGLFETALSRAASIVDPGHDEALKVEREALVDLTFCYAQVRPPEEAADYLRARARSRSDLVAALTRMARRFAVVEQPVGTATVLRELLDLAPDRPERVEEARLLHRSVTGGAGFDRVGDDAHRILRVWQRRLTDPGQEDPDALTEELSGLVRDLALRAHQESASDQVAKAYAALLTFPPREDRSESLMNLGDVLAGLGRSYEAGTRYREAALIADEETAHQARYEAAVAFQRVARAPEASLGQRRMARAGLRDVAGAWLVRGGEADRERTLQLAVAESWLDEGAHDRAIDLLTATALRHPGTEQADAAVLLALEAYDLSGDLDGFVQAGQRFLKEGSPLSARARLAVEPLVAGAEQRRLDTLMLAAAGSGTGEIDQLLSFVDRYEGTELGERALLSTFVAARAQGDAALVERIGAEVLQRFPGSDQAGGIAATLGQTAASRYDLDAALTWLRRAAAATGDKGQRAALHLGMADLSEQLGAYDEAAQATSAAMALLTGDARAQAAARWADLLELTEDDLTRAQTLGELAWELPEIGVRAAHALVRAGELEEAEALADEALQRATDEATRTHAAYVRGEAGLTALARAPVPSTASDLDQTLSTLDATLGSYLQAARHPEARMRHAALARLARAAQHGARTLASATLSDLTAVDAAPVLAALRQRSEQLELTAGQALAQCASAARAEHSYDLAARACLAGQGPAEDPTRATPLRQRTRTPELSADASRDRLASNPDDVQALRELGLALLRGGDAHTARIALLRLSRLDPTAEDLVALGDAALGAGDVETALHALSRAHALGSDIAERRFTEALDELGGPAVTLGALSARTEP